MWPPDLLNTDSVKDRNLCILDRINANVGYMNLCILGGLFTIESALLKNCVLTAVFNYCEKVRRKNSHGVSPEQL